MGMGMGIVRVVSLVFSKMASSKRVSILSKHLAPQAAAGQEIEEVYIVGVSRTALGCFGGALKDKTAPELGSAAIIAALKNAGVSPDAVNEVFMGNVLSANIGQAPAKQAQLGARTRSPLRR
jgi:hypothetical protein